MTKLCQFFFMSVLLQLCLCLTEKSYEIPNPEFAVYNDGFSVSVPDEPGIEIFFFYGSVNRVTAFLEPDTIIMGTKEKIGGKWILWDNNTAPQMDEFIHYWLYVKKDGCHYRKDADFYYVNAIIPHSIQSILGTAIKTQEEGASKRPLPGSTFPFQFHKPPLQASSSGLTQKPSKVGLQEPIWGTIDKAAPIPKNVGFSLTHPGQEISKASTMGPKLPLVVTRECETHHHTSYEKKKQAGLIFDTPLDEHPTPCPTVDNEKYSDTSTEPYSVVPNLVSHPHSLERNENLGNQRDGKLIAPKPNVLHLLDSAQSTEKVGVNQNTWTWSV